jgi:hypothetical protein
MREGNLIYNIFSIYFYGITTKLHEDHLLNVIVMEE